MGTEDRTEQGSGKRMSKKWIFGLAAAGALAVGGKFAAFDNIVPTFVDPTNYGVRVRSGEIAKGDEHLKNGLYWTRLFFDKIYMLKENTIILDLDKTCLLYTSPSPRDRTRSRMPSSA